MLLNSSLFLFQNMKHRKNILTEFWNSYKKKIILRGNFFSSKNPIKSCKKVFEGNIDCHNKEVVFLTSTEIFLIWFPLGILNEFSIVLCASKMFQPPILKHARYLCRDGSPQNLSESSWHLLVLESGLNSHFWNLYIRRFLRMVIIYLDL